MKFLRALGPDWPQSDGVRAAFFSRIGGHSAAPFDSFNTASHVGDSDRDVTRNRDLLLEELPENLSLQWLNQVHGTTAHRLRNVMAPLQGDALVTDQKALACCVLTADCLPVFCASDQGDEVGLAHAGWRGLAAGVLEQTLALMHTPPHRLRVWLGPAIGPCHFEVGEEVRQAFHQLDAGPATADCFRSLPEPGQYLADLYRLARQRLQGLGVEEISGGNHCTFCDRKRFYSYRRDGSTGRNLSLIYCS